MAAVKTWDAPDLDKVITGGDGEREGRGQVSGPKSQGSPTLCCFFKTCRKGQWVIQQTPRLPSRINKCFIFFLFTFFECLFFLFIFFYLRRAVLLFDQFLIVVWSWWWDSWMMTFQEAPQQWCLSHLRVQTEDDFFTPPTVLGCFSACVGTLPQHSLPSLIGGFSAPLERSLQEWRVSELSNSPMRFLPHFRFFKVNLGGTLF